MLCLKELQPNDFAFFFCAQNLSLVVCLQRDTNQHLPERHNDIAKVCSRRIDLSGMHAAYHQPQPFKRNTWTLPGTFGLNGKMYVRCETRSEKNPCYLCLRARKKQRSTLVLDVVDIHAVQTLQVECGDLPVTVWSFQSFFTFSVFLK